MANTYDWKINQLDAKIKQDGKDNVIYTVHWSYIAKDDSEPDKYMASSIGTISVEYKDGDPFIEYADLKKSDVVNYKNYDNEFIPVSLSENNIKRSVPN